MIEENYKKFPDYLFARIQYVELHMETNPDIFLEVFGGKMDLKQIFPDRDLFHISEYVSFVHILSRYLAYKEDYKTIKLHKNVIAELDPDHPVIDSLDNLLWLDRLYNQSKRPNLPSRSKKGGSRLRRMF